MLAQDSAAFAGVCRSSEAHTGHSHFALMHPPTSTELTCYAPNILVSNVWEERQVADNQTDKACIQQRMLNRLNCCWCIEYNIIIYMYIILNTPDSETTNANPVNTKSSPYGDT